MKDVTPQVLHLKDFFFFAYNRAALSPENVENSPEFESGNETLVQNSGKLKMTRFPEEKENPFFWNRNFPGFKNLDF